MFQDRDKMVRLFCIRAAVRENLPQLEEFVTEGLRDERPEVVIAALKASRKSTNPEIIGMALTYLESPNHVLRAEALNSLEKKNLSHVKEGICSFLRTEEDPALLATGIRIIGSFKSPEFIPLLKAFLAYEDDRVRANATEAIGFLDDPEVVEILHALVPDKNNRVRANAIKSLWDKGHKFGLNTLPEELRSPNPRKRASVAYILGFVKDERFVDLLIGLLDDVSPTVRNRAVLSLGKTGTKRVVSHLIQAYAKEDEPKIRDTIILTCFTIDPNHSLARLSEKFIQEEEPRVRANLIRSVGHVKQSQCVSLLIKALKDTDPRVRANAVEGVILQEDSSLSELLFPLLNDSNNRVRSNAAMALWRMGGAGSITTLKQMLRSTHKQMRSSAAWALGEIGALQFSDILHDLSNDGDPDVRKCALKALAKLAKIA